LIAPSMRAWTSWLAAMIVLSGYSVNYIVSQNDEKENVCLLGYPGVRRYQE